MFKSLAKGFSKLRQDVNTVVGNIRTDIKGGKQKADDEPSTSAVTSGDACAVVAEETITCTSAPVSNAVGHVGEVIISHVPETMSFFRRYTRGWTPRFDVDFDDFFRRPTIRDTGKGSARRRTDVRRRDYEEERPQPKSYEEIKAECLENGELWEDPDFPAEDASLYYKTPPSGWPDIEWLRPKEICERAGVEDDPLMFVEGASRLDVNQGVLGDCWLLAAVSCLATNERLLHRVVPEQSFVNDYAGVFRFMFWQYGRWVEVVVDDRLPCCNDKLIYMHSDDRNEFWSALLEKAYAKLNGCYENLSGGLTTEALTDFTGGMSERFELRDKTPDDLFRTMHKAVTIGAMLGCSIDASPDQMEAQLDNGLIIGHAYSITSVRYVSVETPRVSGRIPMVRVRNPWGDSHEWKGPWSDDSEEWTMVPDEEKEELGLTYDHDGEFWMAYSDFKEEFQRVEICYLGPDTLIDEDMGDVAEEVKKWEGKLMEGSWRRRVNAGGCKNFPSFWCNPQYRITVVDPDEDDEDGNGSIIIGLMQKERRKLRQEGKDNLTVGFAIYHLEDEQCGTLDDRFFATHRMTARSPNFINSREVSDHYSLPPGCYVVVPSTFEPDHEGDFILRVFSERSTDSVQEIDDQTGTYTSQEEEEGVGEDSDDDIARREEGYDAFKNTAGEDGEVDAYELKDMLNGIFQQVFEFDGFSVDMCRSMVAMTDADMSGKLNYRDYKSLWDELNMCLKAFRKMDTDGSGHFNSYEFRRVLNSLASSVESLRGLRISNSTFNAIVMRYSDKEGHVHFDDFVACVIKLKMMFETFRGKSGGDGDANFQMDEFIQMTMYS